MSFSYYDRKTENIAIFNDTAAMFFGNWSDILESINDSKIYSDKLETIDTERFDSIADVYVTRNKTTTEILSIYSSYPVLKIAALNFASATHPGGKVINGSSAQEEDLCRTTTLYPVISDEKFRTFYKKNRKDKFNTIYKDELIYSPNILVLKDSSYNKLDKKVYCDIITCAAPNIRNWSEASIKKHESDLMEIYRKRIDLIFASALEHKADIIILGAWGCGVFKNPPDLIALAFSEAINRFKRSFRKIIFPIYDNVNTNNYDVFIKILGTESVINSFMGRI